MSIGEQCKKLSPTHGGGWYVDARRVKKKSSSTEKKSAKIPPEYGGGGQVDEEIDARVENLVENCLKGRNSLRRVRVSIAGSEMALKQGNPVAEDVHQLASAVDESDESHHSFKAIHVCRPNAIPSAADHHQNPRLEFVLRPGRALKFRRAGFSSPDRETGLRPGRAVDSASQSAHLPELDEDEDGESGHQNRQNRRGSERLFVIKLDEMMESE